MANHLAHCARGTCYSLALLEQLDTYLRQSLAGTSLCHASPNLSPVGSTTTMTTLEEAATMGLEPPPIDPLAHHILHAIWHGEMSQVTPAQWSLALALLFNRAIHTHAIATTAAITTRQSFSLRIALPRAPCSTNAASPHILSLLGHLWAFQMEMYTVGDLVTSSEDPRVHWNVDTETLRVPMVYLGEAAPIATTSDGELVPTAPICEPIQCADPTITVPHTFAHIEWQRCRGPYDLANHQDLAPWPMWLPIHMNESDSEPAPTAPVPSYVRLPTLLGTSDLFGLSPHATSTSPITVTATHGKSMVLDGDNDDGLIPHPTCKPEKCPTDDGDGCVPSKSIHRQSHADRDEIRADSDGDEELPHSTTADSLHHDSNATEPRVPRTIHSNVTLESAATQPHPASQWPLGEWRPLCFVNPNVSPDVALLWSSPLHIHICARSDAKSPCTAAIGHPISVHSSPAFHAIRAHVIQVNPAHTIIATRPSADETSDTSPC